MIIVLTAIVLAAEAGAGSPEAQRALEVGQVNRLSTSWLGANVSVRVVVDSQRTEDVLGAPVDPAQFPESVLVVRRVVISVGDVDLFVPRSIYADLLWVHEGRLRQQGKVLQLILLGGDGAESYRVVVEFDKKGVRKRTLFGGESQKPTQETIYYKVVIG